MIKQAIIPLAGLGTRLLPLTSVFPKELLPINGKIGLEYILDECIEAGVKEIILIISKKKELIKKGYKIIMWDVISGDFDKKTTPEKCLENVIQYANNGSIIVMHDSKKAKEKKARPVMYYYNSTSCSTNDVPPHPRKIKTSKRGEGGGRRRRCRSGRAHGAHALAQTAEQGGEGRAQPGPHGHPRPRPHGHPRLWSDPHGYKRQHHHGCQGRAQR